MSPESDLASVALARAVQQWMIWQHAEVGYDAFGADSMKRVRPLRWSRSSVLIALAATAVKAVGAVGASLLLMGYGCLDVLVASRNRLSGSHSSATDRAALGAGHDRAVVPVRRRAHADVRALRTRISMR